jgi:hypothetical protein
MLNRVDRLPVPQRDALRTVFGISVGPPPDRFMVALAVLGLLAEVATDQPLVCVVDDEQWLDQATAQALGFVARLVGPRREPQDIRPEPCGGGKLAVEGGHRRHRLRQDGERGAADRRRRQEGGEDGHVGRDTQPGGAVEPDAVAADGRLSRRHLHQDGAFG